MAIRPPLSSSCFSRIFKKFKREKQEDLLVIDNTIREDMKSLGMSFFQILDTLPAEEKVKLKESREFENVKELLRKYEVIK